MSLSDDRGDDFEFVQECNSQAADRIIERFTSELPGPDGGTEAGRREMAREIFNEEVGGWSDFRRRAVIESIHNKVEHLQALEELSDEE